MAYEGIDVIEDENLISLNSKMFSRVQTKLTKTNIKDMSAFLIDSELTQDILFELPKINETLTEIITDFISISSKRNVLIMGPPGVGKTSIVKLFMSIAENSLGKDYPLENYYVNCKDYPTKFKVMNQILGGNKRESTPNLIPLFKDKFSDQNKKYFIILDEIDFLTDADGLLYSFSRDPAYRNCLIFIITNKSKFYDKLSDSVKSSFGSSLSVVYFGAYDASQILSILKLRCQKGLFSFNEDILQWIAGKTCKEYKSDVRVAILTAQRVFNFFDENNIQYEEINQIMKEVSEDITSSIVANLTDGETIILQFIIEDEKNGRSDKLRDRFVAYTKLSRTQFLYYLNLLIMKNVIFWEPFSGDKPNLKMFCTDLSESHKKIIFQKSQEAYFNGQ